MKTFSQLVAESRKHVKELMPWDLHDLMESETEVLLLDIREFDEYCSAKINPSIHIPRGVLETACETGFKESNERLINARNAKLIVICRSGNRSLLAASTLQTLGYNDVYSLQTGLRGWNDYELPLYNNADQEIDTDSAEILLF